MRHEFSHLWDACKTGNVEVINTILANNPDIDINFKDENGYAALHWAAANGHELILSILLDKKADIEIKTNNQSTPLHKAATNGHLNAVNFLLSQGAQINATTKHPKIKDFSGRTPLHEAAWCGHDMIIRLLLSKGARADIKTESGKTARDLAHENNKHHLKKIL